MATLRLFAAFLMIALPAVASAQLNEAQLAARRAEEESFVRKFRGSLVSFSTYLGAGTFVLDSHSDNPFVSQEVLVRPRFWLSARQNLQLLWLLECEYTDPDDPAGRRCWPSDLGLSYHHVRLWQDPWLSGRLMGSASLWLPTSLESQTNHTVMNLRVSLLYLATVLKGRLQLFYGFAVQKYLPAERVRGFLGQEDDAAGLPLCLARGRASADGACGSGGPLNDNWLLVNSFGAQWYFRPDLWLSASLSLWNFFRYAVDEAGSDPALPRAGRADLTWGTLELAYQWRQHYVFALGLTSRQPALTADGSAPRFPFWDFISPSNNFSKAYVTATWVY